MQFFTEPLTAEETSAIHAFADGIECGAALHPRGFGRLFAAEWNGDDQPLLIRTCAFGAALECKLVEQGITLGTVRRQTDLIDYNATNLREILEMYDVPSY